MLKKQKKVTLEQLLEEKENLIQQYERDKERWFKSKDPDDLHFIVSSMAILNAWDRKILHHRYQKIDEENRIYDMKFKEERKLYD